MGAHRTLAATWVLSLLVGLGCFAARAATAAVPQDVNGDGLADVAYTDEAFDNEGTGASVVFGTRDRGAPAAVNAGGFRITGIGIKQASVIGDVNGDGLADVLVVAHVADETHLRAYVIYGSRQPAPVNLGAPAYADGTLGTMFATTGAAGAGDVNGDGLADIVSAQGRGRGRTLARVRLGAPAKPLSAGFAITASARLARTDVVEVAAAGDTNGDGLADVAIAVNDPNGRKDVSGDVDAMVFVVWGKRDPADVSVSETGTTASARVRAGTRPGGRAIAHSHRECLCEPGQITAAGDLNGDRRGELGISWQAEQDEADARTDFVAGSRSSRPLTLTGKTTAPGVVASVRVGDFFTPFVPVGDADGDGRDDVLIGAYRQNGASVLDLLSGATARRVSRLPLSTPPLISSGTATVISAVPAGDTDGDGHGDLLIGTIADRNADGQKPSYAIVHGAPRLAAVDLRAPGTQATALPRA